MFRKSKITINTTSLYLKIEGAQALKKRLERESANRDENWVVANNTLSIYIKKHEDLLGYAKKMNNSGCCSRACAVLTILIPLMLFFSFIMLSGLIPGVVIKRNNPSFWNKIADFSRKSKILDFAFYIYNSLINYMEDPFVKVGVYSAMVYIPISIVLICCFGYFGTHSIKECYKTSEKEAEKLQRKIKKPKALLQEIYIRECEKIKINLRETDEISRQISDTLPEDFKELWRDPMETVLK